MSLVALGKTIAATGGFIGSVMSLPFWGVSGGLSLSEMVYVVSIFAGSILGMACGFLPKVGDRVQGAAGLFGGLLIIFGATYMSSCCPSNELLNGSVRFYLSFWAAMIVMGCVLLIARRATRSDRTPGMRP